MESLYTKYRPQTFADVVGQTHVVSTLEHAVIEGRTSHAYLFCGPRGTGKTTMARLLAKALMCEQGEGHLPDGTCDQCRMIAAGEHPDVYELDAASRTGVDNVRDEIISRVSFAPVQAPYKMYIIDEVHMLTTAAFNALLKTLEEPPAHVVFVLCTTDPQKIPETILSRVQRFDFHAISNADIQGRLAYICEREGFGYDPEALELVVRHARGGMRDAISELEQLSVSGGGSITVDVARDVLGEVSASTLERISLAMANRDVPTLFAQVESLVEVGRDLLQFTRALAARLRDVYVVAAIGVSSGIVSAADDDLPAISREAKAFGSVDRVARALALLSDASTEMRVAPNQRLVLEVAFTKIARPQAELTLDALADRVATLEKQIVALSVMEPRRTAEAPRGREARETVHADAPKAREAARASQAPTGASTSRAVRAGEASANATMTHERPAQAVSLQGAAAYGQSRPEATRGDDATSSESAVYDEPHAATWATATQAQTNEADASTDASAQGVPHGGTREPAQAAAPQASQQAGVAGKDVQHARDAQTMPHVERTATAAPTAATQAQTYESDASNGAPEQRAPHEGTRGPVQAATTQASQQLGGADSDVQHARAAQTLPDAAKPTTGVPASAQAAYGQAPQQQDATEPAHGMLATQNSAITDKGELQRRWKQVVDGLLAAHPQHGSLLMNSSIVADDGYQLTVSFPKGSMFACRMLDRQDVRANVDPMIAQVFGPRKARFAEGATAPASPAGATAHAASAPGSGAASAGGGASPRGTETAARTQRSQLVQPSPQSADSRPAGAPATQAHGAASASPSRTASASREMPKTASAQTAPSYPAPWETEAATVQPGATPTQSWQSAPAKPAGAAHQSRQETQQETGRSQAGQPAPAQAHSAYPAPWETEAATVQQKAPSVAAWNSAPLDDDMVPYDDLDTSPYEDEFAFGDVPEYLSQAAPAFGAQPTAAGSTVPAPGMARASDVAMPQQAAPSADPWAAEQAPAGLASAAHQSQAQGAPAAQPGSTPQQQTAPNDDPWATGHAPAVSASAAHQSQAQGMAAAQPGSTPPKQSTPSNDPWAAEHASAASASAAQLAATPEASDLAQSPEAEATVASQPTGAAQANAAGGAPAAPADSAPAQQQAASASAKPRKTRRPAAAIPADIIAMMAEIFGEGVTYTSIAPDDQEDEVVEEPAGEDAAESEFVDEPVDDADYDEDE